MNAGTFRGNGFDTEANEVRQMAGIGDLLKQMADTKEDRRRSFFEFTVLPQFKSVSPLERDQLINKVSDLLKPQGITKAAVRKMVQSEIKPPKETKLSGNVVEFPKQFNRSDVGNARRFMDRHGEYFRYCHKSKVWYMWDGTRWAIDSRGTAERCVYSLSQYMQSEAAKISDPDERTTAFTWAVQLEGVNRVKNCLEAAQPLLSVEPDDFERDPWLLNCLNGTVDLRTGKLKPHNREDMISKVCPVAYDPEALSPEWEKFLNRIFDGDKQLIIYIKKALGYSLVGEASEEEFYVGWGVGGNGKSKLIECIRGMLGDYATSISPDTITDMRENRGGATPELARLPGIRFLASQETERGKSLREAFIKSVTGRDSILVRDLYGKPFSFTPAFKLWFSTNFKPEINGGGEGLWRRVRLIPFNVIIPPEERDKKLPEKLQKEWPGILRWCVDGCREWIKEGLEIPETVLKATEEYRQESDTFAQFLSDRCIIGPGAKVTNKTLKDDYLNWCKQNGETAIGQREFTAKLKERGLENKRSAPGGGTEWHGIRLTDYGA